MKKKPVIVRGGGDLATGTIYKLVKCGFPVLVLEVPEPSSIRRNVAFSEAVYDGKHQVEDMTAYLAKTPEEAVRIMDRGAPAVMVDPKGEMIAWFHPEVVIDAIIAKKNLGTSRDMAPLTIALGPGFEAGVDVDYCIETKRGHRLGRILEKGCCMANTGIPGIIGGYGKERVVHSPCGGRFYGVHRIRDLVSAGEILGYVRDGGEQIPVTTEISGILRGILRDDYPVTKGFKLADVDPRIEELENCDLISDKARCIAGGVLEAIFRKDVYKV